MEGLFEILANKFMPQSNKTTKSLQLWKLSRQNGENAEEWMGRLWLAVIECNYKEIDRQLREQFIHGLNDTDMLREIIQEFTKIMKMQKSLVKKCWPGVKEWRYKEPHLP